MKSLLDLPSELRNYIYELVLCTEGDVVLLTPSMRRYRDPQHLSYQEQRFDADRLEPNYPPGDAQAGRMDSNDDEPEDPTSDDGDEEWEDDSGSDGHAANDTVYDHLLVQNNGPAHDSSNLGFGLFFHNGKLTLGPHLDDGEDEDEWDQDSDEDEDDDEDYSDEDDDGDDDDEDSTEDSDDDLEDRPRRRSYKMQAWKPLDVSLLRVNRQINTEATPILYDGNRFVPVADGVDTLRFLKTLPTRGLHNITTLVIPSDQLMGDDGPSRHCWSTTNEAKPLTRGCPAMVTPMGTFLASEMPGLTDVYLYTPIHGDEEWYCIWAPIELCKLLCHGRIQRLHYVFMGEEVAKALRDHPDSQNCFDYLYDSMGDRTAKHEFEMKHPGPTGPFQHLSEKEHEKRRLKTLKRFDDRDEYVRRHKELFAWKWGDRDITMGTVGHAQAVITTWMKSAAEH